jgi:DoxX-like family
MIPMSAATQVNPLPNVATSISRTLIWVGRVVSTLVVLFCAFDGIMKVIKEPHVIAASAEFGFSTNEMVLIGVLMLACTVLYAIPRTAILGAVLLTGYLGGAVLANIHVGHPLFECIFPVIFGALAWGGVFVREARLRELTPFRK